MNVISCDRRKLVPFVLGALVAACASARAVPSPSPEPAPRRLVIDDEPPRDVGARRMVDDERSRDAGARLAPTVPNVAAAPGPAAEIFVGFDRACIRTADGEVWCWSGLGTDNVPRRMLLPARAVHLDQGEGLCAVLEDGTAACWGTHAFGAVPSRVSGEAVRIPQAVDVVAMNASGVRAYFVRRNGSVFVVENSYAPKGARRREIAEVPWLAGAREIASNERTTCARMADDSARCWSWATSRVKRKGDPPLPPLPPIAVTIPASWSLAGVTAIDRGCAVVRGGSVRCWGDNDHATIGDGTTIDRATPVSAVGANGALQISRGAYVTCAVITAGGLRCWGDSSEEPLIPGQPRRLHPTATSVAVPDANASAPVAEVRVGVTHACARLVDGRVACWGDNWDGRIGDGSKDPSREPSFVVGFGRSTPASGAPSAPPIPERLVVPLLATDIAAGGNSTCAVLRDGSPRCWGDNDSGKLGDGTITPRSRPTANPYLKTVSAIRPGENHTCALEAGNVWCWGMNATGQLGLGDDADHRVPTKVPGLSGVKRIAVGGFSCALGGDDSVRCWGDYDSGAGDPAPSGSKTPTAVADANGMIELAVRGTGGCGRTAAGDVRCFGWGVLNELSGGRTPKRIARPVRGLGRARSIAAGRPLCAVLESGSVRCWGAGDAVDVARPRDRNDAFDLWTPSLARGYDHVLDLSVGEDRSCARTESKELRCWEDGALVRPALRDVVKVAHGKEHACALLGSGEVHCWGKNASGQLGDGTTTDRKTPIRVEM